MNCWEFLEIEPTEEKSVIKKAYAKKLKQYHPEDDPAGYQQLREAYDLAQKLVQQEGLLSAYDDDECSNSYDITEFKDAVHEVTLTNEASTYHNENSEYSKLILADTNVQAVSNVIAELEEIYTDGTKRMRVSVWREWLQREVFWDLDLHEQLFYRITTFIESHHYLPREVWKLLDQQLLWQENIGKLYTFLDRNFVEYLLLHVNPGLPIMTPFWIGGKYNLNNYYQEMEAIYYEINYGTLTHSKKIIESAMTKWGRDHNVMLFYGELEIRKNNLKLAMDTFKEIRKAIPENSDACLIIGKLLMYYGKYKDALSFLTEVLKSEPQNIEALILAAECEASNGKLKNAHKFFMLAAEQVPTNPNVLAFGNRLFRRFENELKKRIFIAKLEVFLDDISIYTGQKYDKSIFSKKSIILIGMLNFMILLFKLSLCIFVIILLMAAIVNLPYFGILLAILMVLFCYKYYQSTK